MKLYNSYSNKTEEFVPVENNKVRMYVCGPTVYDFPHLGHARCYITWDMVYRYLKFKGYEVTYARNITDVDDKIIAKAKAQNTTPEDIASIYTGEFKKAMEALNILSPDIEPLATRNIGEMIKLVKTLENKGFAYEADGDVYFRVKKFKKYGNLSNQKIEDLEAGARIEASGIKEDPLDFALWKKTINDDEISWSSPWGKGRPGWHLECSAMIKKVFNVDTIDIHAGGQDLLFPHHENEIAQSECAHDKNFAKYWMHNGFVTINKEKMSKSLGNFVSIDKLLETYDSDTIRFFILTNHYRMPVGFADEALESAKAGVKKLKNAVENAFNYIKKSDLNLEINSNEEKDFIEAMDEDFNTSKALAVFFDLANKINKSKDEDNKDYVIKYTSILIKLSSVLGFELDKGLEIQISDEFLAKIKTREDAKANKDWAVADAIRNELSEAGILLKDNKDGTTSWSLK